MVCRIRKKNNKGYLFKTYLAQKIPFTSISVHKSPTLLEKRQGKKQVVNKSQQFSLVKLSHNEMKSFLREDLVKTQGHRRKNAPM